jgi:hypothetical protein
MSNIYTFFFFLNFSSPYVKFSDFADDFRFMHSKTHYFCYLNYLNIFKFILNKLVLIIFIILKELTLFHHYKNIKSFIT